MSLYNTSSSTKIGYLWVFFLCFLSFCVVIAQTTESESSHKHPNFAMLLRSPGLISSYDFYYIGGLKDGYSYVNYDIEIGELKNPPNNYTYNTMVSTPFSDNSGFYYALGQTGELYTNFTLYQISLKSKEPQKLGVIPTIEDMVAIPHQNKLAFVLDGTSIVMLYNTQENSLSYLNLSISTYFIKLTIDPETGFLIIVTTDRFYIVDTTVGNGKLLQTIKFNTDLILLSGVIYNPLSSDIIAITSWGEIYQISKNGLTRKISYVPNYYEITPAMCLSADGKNMYFRITDASSGYALLYNVNLDSGDISGEAIYSNFLHFNFPLIEEMFITQ